jgi:hypothetical protein
VSHFQLNQLPTFHFLLLEEIAAMDEPPHNPSSHLFMVRFWSEEVESGRVEWRGQVQYVSAGAGEVHYFRDCATLVAKLQTILSPASGANYHPSLPDTFKEMNQNVTE